MTNKRQRQKGCKEDASNEEMCRNRRMTTELSKYTLTALHAFNTGFPEPTEASSCRHFPMLTGPPVCRVQQGITGYHRVSHGITWYHRVSRVSHGTTGCHMVSRGITGYHGVPHSTTVYHWVSHIKVRCCW